MVLQGVSGHCAVLTIHAGLPVAQIAEYRLLDRLLSTIMDWHPALCKMREVSGLGERKVISAQLPSYTCAGRMRSTWHDPLAIVQLRSRFVELSLLLGTRSARWSQLKKPDGVSLKTPMTM